MRIVSDFDGGCFGCDDAELTWGHGPQCLKDPYLEGRDRNLLLDRQFLVQLNPLTPKNPPIVHLAPFYILPQCKIGQC